MISVEDKELIKMLYTKDLKPYYAIVRQLNFKYNIEQIKEVCNETGKEYGTSRRLSIEDKAELIRRYVSGESVQRISNETLISQVTLKRLLTKAEVYKFRGSDKTDEKEEVVVEKKERKKKSTSDVVTMEDKIKYCNKKYGVGKWRFMSYDELRVRFIYDR